jgi:hypothetical protein
MGIACHSEAIGRRFRCRKERRERIVACRNNACCGVEAADPATPHIVTAIGLCLERKGKFADRDSRAPRKLAGFWRSQVQNSMCRQTLNERSERRTKVRFILPSVGRCACAPISPRHIRESSRHSVTSVRSHHCGMHARDPLTTRPSACSTAVGGPALRASAACNSSARGSLTDALGDAPSNSLGFAGNNAPGQPGSPTLSAAPSGPKGHPVIRNSSRVIAARRRRRCCWRIANPICGIA